MNADVLNGRCLCGAVTIRIAGTHDPALGACHCRMCQRWSGGLFLAFDADEAGVTVTGPVTRYASSSFAERAFCAVCGSHLWLRDIGPDDKIYELMPGLFDAAADWPLRSEVYSDCALASVQLKGAHRRTTKNEYEQNNLYVAGDAP